MRIASWNVNSIRARQHRVIDWLTRIRPDIALLQETKCDDETFHSEQGLAQAQALGYEMAHHGVNHWNGVAILSRVGLDGITKGFEGANRSPFDEARLITAVCGNRRVASLYAPNGRSLDDPHYLFKLVWLERLRAELTLTGVEIAAGDFNVAPTDLDIYDPRRWRHRTHASPPERDAITALLDVGFDDLARHHHPQAKMFTWWSYRPGQFEKNHGLRIDLALCRRELASQVKRVWVDLEERAKPSPSDHAPLIVEMMD